MDMDAYLAQHVVRVGRGEPLLLIHGLGHRKEGWDPVLPLVGAAFETVALDLPGFGGAPPLPVPPTDEALTDHCERLLDELGWSTAHVAGNSLGGLIALRLGMRGRARSVTALSPGGKMVGWEQTWARGFLRLVRAAGPLAAKVGPLKDTAVGRRLAMGAIFGRPERMSPGYAQLSLDGLGLATSFEAVLETADWDVGDVKPIEVPVTIAWGTRDVLLWPWQGQRWHAALPGSRLVRLPGLGHTPMPDDPEMVAEVILRTARAARAA